MSEEGLDKLWKEYRFPFCDFDDLTLARWLSQTLAQLEGRSWRGSHPLVSAARVAAEEANERQIWLKRLATPPPAYLTAECCRSPLLPVFNRDITTEGLTCFHCNETCVVFEEIPEGLQTEVREWSGKYSEVHAVAHWDDDRRRRTMNYNESFESAAEEAEKMLAHAGKSIVPQFLSLYAAIVWEDQDECLEIRAEDIILH